MALLLCRQTVSRDVDATFRLDYRADGQALCVS